MAKRRTTTTDKRKWRSKRKNYIEQIDFPFRNSFVQSTHQKARERENETPKYIACLVCTKACEERRRDIFKKVKMHIDHLVLQ